MLTCIDPQALAEGQLQEYAADPTMADRDVAQHIQRCPACQAEVISMRTLASHLGRALYRYDCLATDTILDLATGLLPRAERIAAEAHLQLCARCTEELHLATAALAQPESLLAWQVPTRLEQATTSMRRIVAILVNSLAPNGPDLAMGINLRSRTTDTSSNPQMYSAEDIMLAVRGIAGVGGTIQVDGLISSATDASLAITDIPVRLFARNHAADAPAALVAEDIAEGGIFSLGPIPAGRYTLEIALPDRTIAIEEIVF